MRLPIVSWCGLLLTALGVFYGNEMMISTGVILCAVEASAERVIESIEKSSGK